MKTPTEAGMRAFSAFLLATLGVLACTPARWIDEAPTRAAQSESPVAGVVVGTRVRATAPTVLNKRTVGNVANVSRDSLWIRDERRGHPVLGLSWDRIEKLEVAHKNRTLGFVFGAVLGAGIGALTPRAEGVEAAPMIGASAAGGALAGLLVPIETWHVVAFPRPQP